MSHPRIVQDPTTRTSDTASLVRLRDFGPEVNPDAPAMGAYKK
jgi:hypothetical protein